VKNSFYISNKNNFYHLNDAQAVADSVDLGEL